MSRLKTYFVPIFKYIFIFGILILSFNLLLYLACSFPSELIYENALSSAETLVEEGGVFKIGLMEKLDNHTEALIINEAYSVDSDDPLGSYMYARKNYQKGLTQKILEDPVGDLYSYSNNTYDASGNPIKDEEYDMPAELLAFLNGNVTTAVNYTRYYHGFLTIFRPLLLFFDISGIRMLLFFVFLFVLAYFSYLVKKKFNLKTMIAFLYSFLVFGYFYVSYSLQQALVFLVMMISSILLLRKIEKYDRSKLYMHLFITGAFANYFDFLTTPVLTLTIPLLLYVLYHKQKELTTNSDSNIFITNPKETFKFIVLSGIFWSLGWALTWISKWLLFSVFYERTGILSTFGQIQHRSYGNLELVFNCLPYSLTILFTSLFMYFILFLIFLILFKNVSFKRFKIKNLKSDFQILFIALIPLAWQVVLFNHSIFTCYFYLSKYDCCSCYCSIMCF